MASFEKLIRIIFYLWKKLTVGCDFFFFLKGFQLMMSTPDNSSLSSNQDINRFLV